MTSGRGSGAGPWRAFLDDKRERLVFWHTLWQCVGAQWRPAATLRAAQDARLRALLRHAAARVPVYRSLYARAGVDVAAVRGADDLWRLPVVTKEDLLAAGPRAYVDESRGLDALEETATSGSLGRRLPIYATRPEAARVHAALWSGWIGLGVRPRDRLLLLAAPHLSTVPRFFHGEFIAVQAPAGHVVERLRDYRPTVLVGSTEAIALLARQAARLGLPERLGVRRAFPFGQTLTPGLAAMIRDGLGIEPNDLYGSTEVSWIGYQCDRRHGLHVPIDRVVVQIARLGAPDVPARPGELGEVIVTSLLRTTTPFIRYRLGDVAAWADGDCGCGRSLPRLSALEGRVQDFLLARDGSWVSPGAVATDLAQGEASIEDHRVVQETPGTVRVLIVPAAGAGPVDGARITAVMQRHLGAVDVSVETVAAIPPDPGWKRRRVYRAFHLDGA